jgi:hypothetical protein
MSGFRTLTIRYGSAGSLICDGSGEDNSLLIVNKDANNSIYLGKTAAVDPADPSNSTPLPSGATTVIDGKVPTYGRCASGFTAVLAVYPNAFGYFQP